MIKTIRIKKNNLDYNINIGNGLFKKYLKSLNNQKDKKFLIIDQKVYKIYKKTLNQYKNLNIIKINGSENIKSIKNYWKIILILLNKKIDRSSSIIAIGGGTIGDLVGFIASTILRGVKFILIPTTLLSQADSSIGGKNGINTKLGKNLVGTFHQPNRVIIDPSFLKSLSFKQIKSGYAEIVKHAIINDIIFYKWLKNNFKELYKLKNKILIKAIEKSVKIKLKFIIKDEKENLKNSSSRAMLNFGHTFGHALESINNYKSNLTHGEAISIGMILAAKLSYKINKISKNQLEDLIMHFKNAKLPTNTNVIVKNKFYKKLINDKKNLDKNINLILLKEIGKAYFARNFKINEIKNLISNINKTL